MPVPSHPVQEISRRDVPCSSLPVQENSRRDVLRLSHPIPDNSNTPSRDICIQRHLLADDGEYKMAMTEASQVSKCQGNCAACLLPSAIIGSTVTHQEALIEDFARNHKIVAVNQALHNIDRVLCENDSSCADIRLPSPQGEFSDEQPSNPTLMT